MDGGIDDCMHRWLNGCKDGCKNGWCGKPGAQHHGQRPSRHHRHFDQHLGQRHRQAGGQVIRGRYIRVPPPQEATSSTGAAHEWNGGWPHHKRQASLAVKRGSLEVSRSCTPTGSTYSCKLTNSSCLFFE